MPRAYGVQVRIKWYVLCVVRLCYLGFIRARLMIAICGLAADMHIKVLSKDSKQWQIKPGLFYVVCVGSQQPWGVASQHVALQTAKSLAVLENQVKWRRAGLEKQYKTGSMNFIAVKFNVTVTKCKVVCFLLPLLYYDCLTVLSQNVSWILLGFLFIGILLLSYGKKLI